MALKGMEEVGCRQGKRTTSYLMLFVASSASLFLIGEVQPDVVRLSHRWLFVQLSVDQVLQCLVWMALEVCVVTGKSNQRSTRVHSGKVLVLV